MSPRPSNPKREVRRVRLPGDEDSSLRPPHADRVATRRMRGQSMVIMALALVALVMIVALAIDGGSMFGERRSAQNSADGSALAGTQRMLDYYQAMVLANPNTDVDGTASQEDDIRNKINDFASRNGAQTSSLHAYFVNANKQIVTVMNGEDHGQGHCGNARPCEVGANGLIPFTGGAIGIVVTARAETPSFFARALGWNTVGGTANATALMGVVVTTGEINLQPIALFTATIDINNMHFGPPAYILIDADAVQGSGNWGWLNYNGLQSSRQQTLGWIYCSYNPAIASHTEWATNWCPAYASAAGEGPTMHYPSANTQTYDPALLPVYVPYVRFGPGSLGWWLAGSSGAVNSNCSDFYNMILTESHNTPDGFGVYIEFPIIDDVRQAGGSSALRYHVRTVARFYVNRPTGNPAVDDVSCRPVTLPTPTYCPTCPTPTPGNGGGGNRTHWFLRGIAKNFVDSAASGQLGDLRKASLRTVFLAP